MTQVQSHSEGIWGILLANGTLWMSGLWKPESNLVLIYLCVKVHSHFEGSFISHFACNILCWWCPFHRLILESSRCCTKNLPRPSPTRGMQKKTIGLLIRLILFSDGFGSVYTTNVLFFYVGSDRFFISKIWSHPTILQKTAWPLLHLSLNAFTTHPSTLLPPPSFIDSSTIPVIHWSISFLSFPISKKKKTHASLPVHCLLVVGRNPIQI